MSWLPPLNLHFLRMTGQLLISVIVITMWCYLQWFLLQKPTIQANQDLLVRAMGILDASVVAVISFWLGSSAGSQAKDVRAA